MLERGHGVGRGTSLQQTEARGFQPTLFCQTPAGISSSLQSVGKEKSGNLSWGGSMVWQRALGSLSLCPGPRTHQHQWGADGQNHKLFMDCGFPPHLPSSRERMGSWSCWNDHPRRITEAAHLSGCCGPFLNTRMVCTSAALALSSSNWCHQDQHYLKINTVVSILIISPPPSSVSHSN